MEEVTSCGLCAIDASCRRELEKACFCFLWNHPKSVMHVQRILWSVRLIIFIPYVYPSTPSHWLSSSQIKESVQGELFGLPRVETSMSLMMVPHLSSAVFSCKTTMWSCLSGTACSHVFVAEPAHVLKLAIVVHFLRISQRHLVDLCCKLSFFFLDSMSLEYPDTT